MLPTPAVVDRGEFPAEIDGIANPGVHAQTAVRRRDVHGVAREQHAAAAIVIRHHAPPDPVPELHDLERDIAADSAAQFRCGSTESGSVSGSPWIISRQRSLPSAGVRLAHAPSVADNHIAAGLALVVLLPQFVGAEHHVERMIDQVDTLHRDAELLAHCAADAVAADKIVGMNAFHALPWI